MNERIIAIANTKTQRRYQINTSATTLGELQDEMAAQGIDFTGMTFTEGISKTQLMSRDSLLPTNVMYKGQPTNNLVMLLTNTTKQISSGVMSERQALYAEVKRLGLQDAIKTKYGKNYTMVGNRELADMIAGRDTDSEIFNNIAAELEKTVTNAKKANKSEFKLPDVKTAPHPEAVEWYYMGLKAMVKSGLLYLNDIAVIADLTVELYKRMLEEQPKFSDKDIDDMIANI